MFYEIHYLWWRFLYIITEPRRLRGLGGSALDHRSLPPEFESDYIDYDYDDDDGDFYGHFCVHGGMGWLTSKGNEAKSKMKHPSDIRIQLLVICDPTRYQLEDAVPISA